VLTILCKQAKMINKRLKYNSKKNTVFKMVLVV